MRRAGGMRGGDVHMHLRGSGSGAWRQLFRQTAGNYRSVEDWLSYNAGDHSGDFSELDQLEGCRQADGKLHMKLVWPELDDAQEWKQTTNPVTDRGSVEGHEAVDVRYSGNYWGGLEHNGGSSLLDGSVDHGNWWYAVGSSHQPARSPGRIARWCRSRSFTRAVAGNYRSAFRVHGSPRLRSLVRQRREPIPISVEPIRGGTDPDLCGGVDCGESGSCSGGLCTCSTSDNDIAARGRCYSCGAQWHEQRDGLRLSRRLHRGALRQGVRLRTSRQPDRYRCRASGGFLRRGNLLLPR